MCLFFILLKAAMMKAQCEADMLSMSRDLEKLKREKVMWEMTQKGEDKEDQPQNVMIRWDKNTVRDGMFVGVVWAELLYPHLQNLYLSNIGLIRYTLHVYTHVWEEHCFG